MNICRTGLAVLLIGSACAAFAADGGFSPEEARDFARSRVAPADRLTGVTVAAEELRAGLVRDPVAFTKARAPLEQAAITGSLGGLNADSAYYLSWLFRSALTSAGAAGEQPVVTYYNPLVDVGIVSLWRRIDSTWRVSALYLFDGAALRDGSSPAWTTADGSAADALAANTLAVLSMARGLAAGRVLPATIEAADLAARIEAIRQRLAALKADAGQARAAEAVRTALVTANPRGLGTASADAPSALQLATLDPAVKASLVTVAAYDRKDGGVSLALGSPLRPGLLFLADLGEGYGPLRLNVLNLTDMDQRASATTGPMGASR